MSFIPVFPQTKEHYSHSSLAEMRNVIISFQYFEGRPKRIRDMEYKHIKRFITKIKTGQIKESLEYSLPYLQLCLETELVVRNRRDNEVANKMLLVFKDPYIRYVVKTTINQ